MSHDHLSLFSLEAFCFAMKSPNPLDLDAVTFGGAVTSELVFSTPNLKEGAVEDGAGAAFDFGAFGFGASHATHFRAEISLETMQISQVHFVAAAAFCFASKSPKPLVVATAGLEVEAGDFGFSSNFEIFGDSGF